MGGLVQQSPAAGAYRQHPAGRGRGILLRHAGPTSHRGVTQTKQPPANPGRFTVRSTLASTLLPDGWIAARPRTPLPSLSEILGEADAWRDALSRSTEERPFSDKPC